MDDYFLAGLWDSVLEEKRKLGEKKEGVINKINELYDQLKDISELPWKNEIYVHSRLVSFKINKEHLQSLRTPPPPP
jgi:hypothetical protein